MTTSYLLAHSLRFHILQPCLDCGDWYEGLVGLEAHLEVCDLRIPIIYWPPCGLLRLGTTPELKSTCKNR